MPMIQGPQVQHENTVTIRVQVIDLESFVLDLTVPTFLVARDLTHRVAQDAGLQAFWPDGRRRLYWLRARGRLLDEQETLGDLGVLNGELVYLLPEPPPGSGVVEQPPDYPETKGYAGSGLPVFIGSAVAVIGWALLWGVAVSVDRSLPTVALPGLALGAFSSSLSRHGFGGRGDHIRVPAVATLIFVLSFVMVFLPGLLQGLPFQIFIKEVYPGFLFGLIGVYVAWLAWWGPVEPLKDAAVQQQEVEQQAEVAVPCGICGMNAEADVRSVCPHGCGQTFHRGCHEARLSVYRGDSRFCAICSRRVA